MKKLFRNFAFCFVFFVVAIGVTTCKGPVALGDTIDINPPKNEITYPPKNAVIRSTFVIAGKCDDDTAVSSVTVSITNTDTKLECGSFEAVLSEDKKSWSVKVENEQTNDPNRTYAGRPYQDGKYSVSAYATDNTGKRSDITSSSFIIDNTPPILLLTASSSYGNSLNPDKFGRTVSLTGTYAEDTDNKIAKMTIRFFKKADGSKIGDDIVFTNVDHMSENNKYVIAKYSKNPTTPEEVKLFENYKAIFGETEINNYTANGTAQDLPVYMTILLEDGARVYDDPSDLTGKEEGNQTTQYYINTDGFTDNFTKDGAQYAMSIFEIKDFLNGKSKKHEGQEAAIATALNAAKSTAYNAEVNSLTGTDTDKASTMLINPKANPTFTVSGYALDKGSVGTTGFNSDGFPYCTEGAPFSITISSGPDNVPVKYVGDKVTIYAVPAESDGSYSTPLPADWLTSENPPTALPAGWVKIANISRVPNKTAHTIDAKPEAPATSYGLSTNTLYRFVIWGRDINGMAIEDGTDGPYGCVVKATGNVPVITSVKAEVNMSPVKNVTGKYVNKSMVGKTLTVSAHVSDGVSLGLTDVAVKSNVTIKAKLNGSVVPDGTVTVTPSADKKSATVKWELTIPASAKDGKWTLTVSAKNKDGASGISESVELTIDTVDPTWKTDSTAGKAPYIDPTQPDNWYSKTAMNVKAKAEDVNGSGIETLKYKLSTSSAWSTVGNDDFSFSCGSAFNGTLTVEAFDKAENKIEVAIPVKVDMAAPNTYALSKVDGQTGVTTKLIGNSTTMVSFEFTASDAAGGSGLKTAEIVKIGNNTLTPAITANETATGSGTFTASIPQAKLAEGAVMVRLTDNAGNTQDFPLFTLQKDVNPPKVNIYEPLENKTVNKNITVSGTAFDGSGLENKVEVFIKTGSGTNDWAKYNVEPSINSGNDWNFTLDTNNTNSPTSGGIGTYDSNSAESGRQLTFKITAKDIVGNVGSEERTITVDQNTDRPQIAVQNLSTLHGGYLTEGTLRGLVQDDDGAVKEFYISEDGSSWTPITLSGNTWSYTLTSGDGAKNIYFKVKDGADGVFISSTSTGELTKPRIYAQNLPTSSSDNGTGGIVQFTLDTSDPEIKAVDATVEGTSASLYVKTIFQGKQVTFTVKAKDGSGIANVKLMLGSVDLGNGSAPSGAAGTEQTSTLTTDFAHKHGRHELKVIVTDGSGKSATSKFDITIDEKAPIPQIIDPLATKAIAGETPIIGTFADDADATSGIVPEGTKYIIKKTEGVPAITDTDWQEMTEKTVSNFSFKYNFNDANLKKDELPAAWKSTRAGEESCYNIPVYILTEDRAGNKAVTKLSVLYDTDGLKPIMTIDEPTPEKTVGGSFTVYGSGTIALGKPSDLTKVYIQFSKSSTFDSTNCNFNGVDWWTGDGKLVDKSGVSWSYVANTDGKLNPTTGKHDIYLRVRGVNEGATPHREGEWCAPIKITVDKDTPAISNVKTKKGSDEKNYTSNMWVSNGTTLLADLTDSSGIKGVVVRYGYAEGEDYTSAKKTFNLQQLQTQNLISSIAGGYRLKLPLDVAQTDLTNKAYQNGAFKVRIEIEDNSSPMGTNRDEYNFRFDTVNPNGGYGSYVAYGNGEFGTNNVNNSIIADALGGSTGKIGNKKILANNFVLTPTNVSGTTVAFTSETGFVAGNYNFVVYESKTVIAKDSILNGVANDDGSGVEKVDVWVANKATPSTKSATVTATRTDAVNKVTPELLGNQCTWKVKLDVTGLPDGKSTLHYKVYDRSGNVKEGTADVFVSNNPIAVSKMSFGTDLDRNNAIAGADEVIGYLASKGETLDKPELTYTVNASDFTWKYEKSNFTAEFSGGNGTISYELKLDGGATIKTGTVVSQTPIELTAADFVKMGSDGAKTLQLTLTDASGWKTITTITINKGTGDTVKPTATILPFYWNNKTDNSVVWLTLANGQKVNLGHIDFDGYKKDGTGAATGRPAISGRVVVSGIAYDDKLIGALDFDFAGLTLSLTCNALGKSEASTTDNSLLAKATVEKLDQTGHYIAWEVAFDTEKITGTVKENAVLKVTAKDKAPNSSIATVVESRLSGTGTRKTNNSIALSDKGDAEFAKIKTGMRMRWFNAAQPKQAHYATIATVIPGDKSVIVAPATEDLTMNSYEIYLSDENRPELTVDIVPYISQVITEAAEEDFDWTKYGRTAKGDYVVLKKDGASEANPIKVVGFNLKDAKLVGTTDPLSEVVVERQAAATQNAYANSAVTSGKYKQTALQFSPTDGELVLQVSTGTGADATTLKTINNYNSEKADKLVDGVPMWNNEGNGSNHYEIGDNRKITIVEAKTLVTQSLISSPSFAVRGTTLGYAYSRATEFFMMQKSNGTCVRFGQSPGSYMATAFAYDEHGNTFGIAGNNDVTMSGTGTISQISSYYLHWNLPGNVSGGFGSGGYGSRTQATRIMALTPESNLNIPDAITKMRRARMQQPVLQTHGDYVYLAYYDMATNQLELRIDKPTRTSNTVDSNTVAGSMTSCAFDGSLTERDKSSGGRNGGNGGQTAGAMVFSTVKNGGSAIGLTFTATRTVVAYKTTSGLELKYGVTSTIQGAPSDITKFDGTVTIDTQARAGEYVRAISSGTDEVVHLCYYDSSYGGRLKYAKVDLSAAAPKVTVSIVDNSEGTVGVYPSITLKDHKPYIVYAIKGLIDSSSTIALKFAYPAPRATEPGKEPGTNGCDEVRQYYTGDWEIMNLQASAGLTGSMYDTPPQLTAFVLNNKLCVGYATSDTLEYLTVPIKY